MSDPGISKAYEELQHVSQDEIMRERAFKREKFLFEQAMRLDAARDEGLREGEERGLERGIEQTAYNLLKMGMNIETVAEGTGLSIKDIKALKKNM